MCVHSFLNYDSQQDLTNYAVQNELDTGHLTNTLFFEAFFLSGQKQ